MSEKHTRLVSALLSVIIWLLSCSAPQVHSQVPHIPKELPTLSSETYEQVLDLVFPRTMLEDNYAESVFVLRFQPSFDPEWQIVIIEREKGFEVFEYRSLDGNMFYKLEELLQRTGQTDAGILAKQIRVGKRRLTVSAGDIKRLYNDFYDQVSKAAQREKQTFNKTGPPLPMLLDDTRYLIWYRGDIKFHLSFDSSDVNKPPHPNEHPLAQWMRNVHLITIELDSRRSKLVKSS